MEAAHISRRSEDSCALPKPLLGYKKQLCLLARWSGVLRYTI
jgi:hypothetical protein